MDLLEMIWVDHEQFLHRLTLRATTIEGVMMIRCVTQDSSFPVLGHLQPPSRGQRLYDPTTCKIVPAKLEYYLVKDDFLNSFRAADRILVCVRMTVNVYHGRDDLRQIIADRPNLFQLVRYERSAQPVTLLARDEKKDGAWDDWDELLATLSEAESDVFDLYETEFFKSLKFLCQVYEYDILEFTELSAKRRRKSL